MDRIQYVSTLWPKKKVFIEGAYKLLLFSKPQRQFTKLAIETMQPLGLIPEQYFDFKSAFNRVMKAWYERRINEEQEKNKKLRELHDSLL